MNFPGFFGLGLFLDSIAGANSTMISNKIGQSKVRRYWPGKAPEWAADEYHVYEDEINTFSRLEDLDIIVYKDDPRLRRLAKSRLIILIM